ncbi:hypothetical protein [Lactobacillus crispatus]|uniref:hypothetical protein n=1 Tax=Lactobacillus crispatus TaxID=47770 RepID=UPI0022ABE132|nr:hypothetical protein [Lactobacillus crispatus]MCZ3846396.1 hypothetical protein [Lactobacillus crispatus]MCZ3848664.1 hypothetical protein [Lactobacillus crispatus]MCZ3854601.1 hypothetical protein [Lactobacillus crispatus]MCZ3856878.1 hypothetical protein [Lactobacillus crispatus]MCZ3859160.1 hypothetical protein [Lactobacillus crispatus]
MSTIRDPAYITNAGRTMMTAGGEVTYTKAVLYGQDISGLSDSQIKALTSLGNPLREVKIGVSDKQSTDSGSTVILEAVFQNNDLKADLEYKAVGFFARKNDIEQLVLVAVANQGAYLAATNPDGVATDALNLKIAVKIGDATSVTAVVDPAGSVTPATLNSAIRQATQELTAKIDTKSNSQDVQNALNLKADKSTVEDSLATKANVTDLNNLSSEVDQKANSGDVDKLINTVSDTVTKNKDAIDKQIASLTTTVNSKVDASYSYSREELDKKLLALSVNTDGKMSAEQVTSMIATKADKSYVDEQLNEKADKSSVDTKINAIDFSKIGFTKQYLTNSNGDTDHHTWFAKKQSDGTWTIDITDASNSGDWTAAIARNNKRDIASLQSNKADTSTVNAKIDEAKNIAKADTDSLKNLVNAIRNFDVASFKGSIPNTDINKITDNGLYGFSNQVLTNSPFSGNTWGLLLVIREYYNDANNIDQFITSNGQLYWRNISLTNNRYSSWKKFASDDDINSLQTQINDRATNSKVNVATTLFREITNSNTWNDIFGVNNPNNVLTSLRIDGGGSGPLLNNYSAGIGFGGQDTKGVLTVDYGDHNARITGGNSDRPQWSEDIAWKTDITSLRNLINQQAQTIQSLTARLTTAESKIQYMQDNYIEGKRFPASQEAQAEAWENEKPTRLAMIEK